MKIEVEFTASRARSVMFAPLDRAVRSQINFAGLPRLVKNSGHLMTEWGDVLPGQRISIDTDNGEAALIEPLHGPEFASVRELIAKRGEKLADARQVFAGAHLPTWLFWIARLRDSNSVTVRSGSLGSVEEIKAAFGPPQLRTFAPVERDRTVDKLVAVLWSLLSDKQRAEAGKALAIA